MKRQDASLKKAQLDALLQAELDALYHNATFKNNLYCETDSEAQLVDQIIQDSNLDAIADLKYTCPKILHYGRVFQWGRGGRTLAPEGLINIGGGSQFSIKSVEDLELSVSETRSLITTLRAFNQLVRDYSHSIIDDTIRYIRQKD